MTEVRARRLTSGDREPARTLFAMMADVFAEEGEPLRDDYLDRLLRRDDFWAIAAFSGDDIIGGVTAHTLPMTRTEASELFVYDIAVRRDRQRSGVGRLLLTALLEAAEETGIQDVFVAADNDDDHALDFYRALAGAPSPVTLFSFAVDRQ
jgi:aminoglycoside 3-N-acetyltransferase I